jgi:beta-glucanase (GH16 family)
MKFICLSVLLINMSSAVIAQQKTDTLFYESFNKTTLDKAKWNVEATGYAVNREQQAYVDSTSVLLLEDGNLKIKPIYHPGYISNLKKSYDFLSGRINTERKFEFTYGTASARIKMSAGAGLWPAFWALGEGKWPDCGEIDMMENIGDSSWVSHALHGPGYFGNTPIVHRYYFPKGFDATAWHVYSVKWTTDSITFSVDDKPTYSVTKQMLKPYGRWAYDNPKYIILNFALGGAYPAGINRTITPYFGLPQSTVDKIKKGEAQMLVDWVLVTKD